VTSRIWFTAAQKAELWERWKNGQSPAAIARALAILMKDNESDLTKDEVATLNAYKSSLDGATKFIPLWVKIAVAIALGLGSDRYIQDPPITGDDTAG
jgi:hypothetical protein